MQKSKLPTALDFLLSYFQQQHPNYWHGHGGEIEGGALISQPCPCPSLPHAVVENTIKENRERQVTCFFASNIRASTVNSYHRMEYKSYVNFSFYVDSTARQHAVLIPRTTQDENQPARRRSWTTAARMRRSIWEMARSHL